MAARAPGKRGTRGRGFDVAALLALAIVAVALRAPVVGAVSLWWDELVHLRLASQEGFWEVLTLVKQGIPPGFGNAGAVPLDYLLLHAWLAVVPRPAPDGLEAYYRTPAFVWNVLTVLLAYGYGRRFFDRGLGLVTATLLALSVSHSLYAAEVRSYSLFALMTVVNLYAFSSLVLGRDRNVPWLLFTLVAVSYFASGFMSLLVLLVQYAILAVLMFVDASTHPGPRSAKEYLRLALPFASGLVVLGVVLLYLQGTFVGATHGRPVEGLSTWERTATAFEFFSGGSIFLQAAFAAGLVLILLHERQRGRDHFAIAAGIVGSFLAIPVIVEIERWKEYYFHPRHAFFLIPVFAIVTAAGMLVALRGLDPLRRTRLREATRDGLYVATVLSLVFATQIGPVVLHLEAPHRRFARTKTLRDFRSLIHHLESRVDALPPGEVYLLITERGRAGHIGNPVLAKYLEWYGLDERVVLRGTDRPNEMRETIERECPDGCVGQPAARVQRRLGAIGPFSSDSEMLDLVEVAPAPQTAAPLGGIGLVHYWRYHQGPPRRAPQFDLTRHTGLTLFEKPLSNGPPDSLPIPGHESR